MSSELVVHLVAGGLGGTVGAVVTCPLEVIKTRLQSSVATFGHKVPSKQDVKRFKLWQSSELLHHRQQMTIVQCFKNIVRTEGLHGLFKGLIPNIVGIAPSRAIYFVTYSSTKSFFNTKLTPDTPYVHMLAAATAGFVCSTITNPIWFIKTRMQLDESLKGLSTFKCIGDIYQTAGIRAFYKGLSASYFGISETIVHFVIYEFIKSKLTEAANAQENERRKSPDSSQNKSTNPANDDDDDSPGSKLNLFHFMAAAATSKFIASSLTYPHEVVRTRLREEGDKYQKFFRTLLLVYEEEGVRRGLYRGLATHLLRQIPNTAITMGIYEVAAYFLKNYFASIQKKSRNSSPQTS